MTQNNSENVDLNAKLMYRPAIKYNYSVGRRFFN